MRPSSSAYGAVVPTQHRHWFYNSALRAPISILRWKHDFYDIKTQDHFIYYELKEGKTLIIKEVQGRLQSSPCHFKQFYKDLERTSERQWFKTSFQAIEMKTQKGAVACKVTQ